MGTFIINTTLLTLCHSEMSQPSNGHIQAARLIHFNSRVNTMSYRM